MKKFRFTTALKLISGFGILALAVISTNLLTYMVIDNGAVNINKQKNTYSPSISLLVNLQLLLIDTKSIVFTLYGDSVKTSSKFKTQLETIHTDTYPKLLSKLSPLVIDWKPEEKKEYNLITTSVDSLFEMHKEMLNQLKDKKTSKYEEYTIQKRDSAKKEDFVNIIVTTDKVIRKLDRFQDSIEKFIEDKNTELDKAFKELKTTILTWGIILLISVLTIAIILTNNLVRPINSLRDALLLMSKGILPKEKLKPRSDEIGQMSDALNMLVVGLHTTSEFSKQIGEGNFLSEFTPLSEADVLGNSLLTMRRNLKNADDEQKRRQKEDEQRSWAAQGLAKFGEILRLNSEDLSEFSYTIISEMVKYLNANQGGLFILNDEDKNDIFIELMACYAFDRRKYMEKRIDIGIGVVGQVVQEGETVYLTEIPNNYIYITSGLGDNNPNAILVIPLKINDSIYGVIELASFSKFEKYQIDFVEKVGQSIASTFASAKTNQNTAKLLIETQKISEQLGQQEEEMRQNIEEMQATQDEMLKQQTEEKKREEKLREDFKEQIRQMQVKLRNYQDQLNETKAKVEQYQTVLNNTAGVYEISADGHILSFTERFVRQTELHEEDLKNRMISEFLTGETLTSNIYHITQTKLRQGKNTSATFLYNFNGKDHWFSETYTPIKDDSGKVTKIIVVSFDVTKDKKREQDWKMAVPNKPAKPSGIEDMLL